MCGIAGFVAADNNDLQGTALLMAEKLHHRGPDDKGEWYDNLAGVGLGHARLSVLDLSSAGSQPMISPAARFVIVFNGEIYNHLKLRKICENTNWKGASDTETLLALIEKFGLQRTLDLVTGMFAFGLWDRRERLLYLVRDRMGEKPLYYGYGGKSFIFASELKALREFPQFKRDINRDSIALLLRHNMIPAPHSIYQGICKLLPGSCLRFSLKHLKNGHLPVPQKYWSLKDKFLSAEFDYNEEEAIEHLEHLLARSVKEQQISEVPLGVFLSGGIDSSLIAALMQKTSVHPVRTFSIGFKEKNYDESGYAEKVAGHLGTSHDELRVDAAAALEVIPKLSSIYDEPFADSSQIPAFLLAQLARQKVTVALSGDGADELFGGYNRYLFAAGPWKYLNRFPYILKAVLSFGANKISQGIARSNSSGFFSRVLALSQPEEKFRKIAGILPAGDEVEFYTKLISHWDKPHLMISGARRTNYILNEYLGVRTPDPETWMMLADMAMYLPDDILHKFDRAAMAASLETRAPYLDHRVVEYALSLPLKYKIRGQKNNSKWILRKILYKYVPPELIERPKAGFALPLDSWLRGKLKNWAQDLLAERRLKEQGFFNHREIGNKLKQHLAGKHNWQYHLWNVLMFQQWLEDNK